MTTYPTPKKIIHLGLIFLVVFVIWVLPHPPEISEQAWHLFAIFFATIVGIILKPLPIGAITIISLAAVVMTKTLTFAEAFSGFSHSVVWLIVLAFFVARGFIKTGLGSRISYLFMMVLGKKTLGLGYGFVLTDLILSPAIPSSTARAGGVMYPVIDSLSKVCKSMPHHPSARRIGAFLIPVAFHSTCITSAMFLTAMAAIPLIAEIAGEFDISLTWGSWALAAIVPGLISLIVVPLVIYWVYPPLIKETPDATEFAREKLEELGEIKPQEWIMLGTFALLITLWGLGSFLEIKAASVALLGLGILLITGVLEWRDISHEGEAWETLVWFAILLTLATQMNKLGLTSWFSNWIVEHSQGFNPIVAFLILTITYYYSHYLFASNLAHVGAMYSGFLSVLITLGTPPIPAALILGFFSSLFGGLTHYACGPAAVLFGAGYVPVSKWWKIGWVVSIAHFVIWLGIGGLWWRILGLW